MRSRDLWGRGTGGTPSRGRRAVRRLITRFSTWNRRRKARAIVDFLDREAVRTVLMVGAAAPVAGLPNQGIVEAAVAPGRDVVMGINLETPATDLGYPFQVADARDMPFGDDYVDFALSNAIIEHVGGEADQRRFVAEHVRVARCWVITTPNRWFPVESHTAALFRHWSPAWRARQTAFTRLLSRRDFVALLPPGTRISGGWWSPTFTAFYSR